MGPHWMGKDPAKLPKVRASVTMKHTGSSMVGGLPRVDSLRSIKSPAGAFRSIRGVPR